MIKTMFYHSSAQPYKIDDIWYHPSWFDGDSDKPASPADTGAGAGAGAGANVSSGSSSGAHFASCHASRKHARDESDMISRLLFHKMFHHGRRPRVGCRVAATPSCSPSSFVDEGNGKAFVSFDLPGVRADDVTVTIMSDCVMIEAVRKPFSSAGTNDETCGAAASKTRKMKYSVDLDDVDPATITANLNDGVLVLKADRLIKQPFKSVQIPVTSNEHVRHWSPSVTDQVELDAKPIASELEEEVTDAVAATAAVPKAAQNDDENKAMEG